MQPPALPWKSLASPLAAAEDSLARLDERLRASPIRDGFVARTHFSDACASLWLEGSLVHREDLVLHDAGRDIRTPTHELTRAYAILRARRRIAEAEPDWALSPAGLAALTAPAAMAQPPGPFLPKKPAQAAEDEDTAENEDTDGAGTGGGGADSAWAAEMAAIDALLTRTQTVTREMVEARPIERDPLLYDPDWDAAARLAEWRAVVEGTEGLPPALSAALALDAWDQIAPLQHTPWLGRLIAAALLRQRGKARAHLPCLNIGLREIPR